MTIPSSNYFFFVWVLNDAKMGGQPDDGKFHHIFTFFNPSLSIIQQRNILIFLLEALIIDIKGSP